MLRILGKTAEDNRRIIYSCADYFRQEIHGLTPLDLRKMRYEEIKMHIPENYLSPHDFCAAMGAVMLPIWYKAVKEVKVKVNTDKKRFLCWESGLPLSFLIMMFNLPAPGGTKVPYAVGAVLIAILLGPWASPV